jgi:hypothetical protein
MKLSTLGEGGDEITVSVVGEGGDKISAVGEGTQ